MRISPIDECIRRSAEFGDAFAQFDLAIALEDGNVGAPDYEGASELYEQAASQGHGAAENNLLLMHVLGRADRIQPEVVFARLMELADEGDIDHQNNLGLCFQHGYGTSQDYEKAKSFFARAATSGSSTAQFNLGGMYFEGYGVPKDLKLAVHWYTKAAQQRDELALIQLGHMYQKGIGLDADFQQAAVLYSIAYKRGSARAANHLASMFMNALGVDRNLPLANQLYIESLNGSETQGIGSNPSYPGTACYWLGKMAENGEGVRRSVAAARRWYTQGASHGQDGCIKALARLAERVSVKRINCRNRLK